MLPSVGKNSEVSVALNSHLPLTVDFPCDLICPLWAGLTEFPKFQSVYRQKHSTETALTKVQNDIIK